MKRTTKIIGKAATLGIMLVSSYLLGTTQARVSWNDESIPDSYINTDSYEFFNNYVDMRKVTDFIVTDDGLQLYCTDGSGYYWER